MLAQGLYLLELADWEEVPCRKQHRPFDFHYFYFLRQYQVAPMLYHPGYLGYLDLAKEFLHLHRHILFQGIVSVELLIVK